MTQKVGEHQLGERPHDHAPSVRPTTVVVGGVGTVQGWDAFERHL
ncbi:MAG: hypothetical protein ACK6CU_06035 [Deltaproteobacteria bacterium]